MSHSVPERLTLADYDVILSAGTEAAWAVDNELRLAWLREARSERELFQCGALVDDDGRQLVINLICLGYACGTAMRAAIQVETESISVSVPAEGWRS